MPDRFELLSQLGKGGMGVVWKARDRDTGDIIAFKLLHSIYLDDDDYVARLEREVEIARRIESPNVVKVLGYGRQDGVPYVAMEYVEGQSLRELLTERGKLGWANWAEAKAILRQTAEGLAAVHAAGVVHRDIKPSNILIAKDGTAKLADFGIARANDLTRMTSSVTMLGTPAYMAPDMETTEQSDLYGLGCVLYEMLSGAPPFVSESQQQVLMRHIREAPDLDKLPADARPIAAWLLEKEVTKRAPSAAAVVAALNGTSHITHAVPRTPHRRLRVAAMVGVPVIVALGGVSAVVGVVTFRGGSRKPVVAVAVDSASPSVFQNSLTPSPTTSLTSVVQVFSPASASTASTATSTDIPPTVTPPRPTVTFVSPTTTPIPPTATPRPPTATPIPPTATPILPENRTSVTVAAANASPTDTGIDVRAGQMLVIHAPGVWCPAQPQNWCGTANGPYLSPAYDSRDRIPDVQIGVLVGRIGSGEWFVAGSDFEQRVTMGGRLTLAMNDYRVDDNGGSLTVMIEVYK